MEESSPHRIMFTSTVGIPYFYNRELRKNVDSLPTYKKLEALGLFHKEQGGTISYTPIGTQFIRKLEKTLSDAAVKHRLVEWEPPTLFPKEMFTSSGRYEIFKDDMIHTADNNHVLHPTGEEWFLSMLKKRRAAPHKGTDNTVGIYHITKAFRNTTAKRRPIRLREFRVLAGYLYGDDPKELHRRSNSFLVDVCKKLGLLEDLKIAEHRATDKEYHYVDYFLETPEGDDRYHKTDDNKYTLSKTKRDAAITGTSVGMFFIDSELVNKVLGRKGYLSAIGVGLDRLLYASFHAKRQGNACPFDVGAIPITRLKNKDDYISLEKKLNDILGSNADGRQMQALVIDSKRGRLSEKINYAKMLGIKKVYLVGDKETIHLD